MRPDLVLIIGSLPGVIFFRLRVNSIMIIECPFGQDVMAALRHKLEEVLLVHKKKFNAGQNLISLIKLQPCRGCSEGISDR